MFNLFLILWLMFTVTIIIYALTHYSPHTPMDKVDGVFMSILTIEFIALMTMMLIGIIG